MSLLVGFSTIAFNGLTNTTLQTTAPDRMLGRVMSVFALITCSCKAAAATIGFTVEPG